MPPIHPSKLRRHPPVLGILGDIAAGIHSHLAELAPGRPKTPPPAAPKTPPPPAAPKTPAPPPAAPTAPSPPPATPSPLDNGGRKGHKGQGGGQNQGGDQDQGGNSTVGQATSPVTLPEPQDTTPPTIAAPTPSPQPAELTTSTSEPFLTSAATSKVGAVPSLGISSQASPFSSGATTSIDPGAASSTVGIVAPVAPSVPLPSVSALSGSVSSKQGSNSPSSNLAAPSHTGAIAGGILGGLILIGLIVLGVIMFMRRRRNRTAPSAEFLTVHPPETPFARAGSFRSDLSVTPAASFTTDKYNSYPRPMLSYP